MNQDNKISSVRPGTISIELFDNYRGLRSVDDIYRVQSAHAENNHEPGVHYKKRCHWYQIMPFIFTRP